VDGSENLYVADMGNDRIQKFTSDGVFLTQWGSDSGDGRLRRPRDIAVDGNGDIYVVNEDSGLIKKFTSDGTFLTAWGGLGSGNGQFDSPSSIAVDGGGNVYVTDTDSSGWGEPENNRVQKFTADGTYLTQWGYRGSGDGQFNTPSGIAVDGRGNVYVADTFNDRIQKFTADGVFLAKWGSCGSGNGQFRWPNGIAVDGSGNIFVVDFSNDRIQTFASDGTFLAKWGSPDRGFSYPAGIAADGIGNVYVVNRRDDRIQKFTVDGAFLTQWGSRGSEVGQFRSPEGIAVDGSWNVYVVDGSNHRIQKFTSHGAFLTAWGELGSGEGQFHWPEDIAVDGSGNVYVVDRVNHRIQKFTGDGTFLTQWGSRGGEEGLFYNPEGIALDGSGNVYVADTWNNRIQKFTGDGTFLTQWGTQWGSPGIGDGQFNSPRGIAVDGSWNVYVVDSHNDRIQKFTSDGAFLTAWGELGSGEGQFRWPADVEVDGSGNVYVADEDNNRIQKFAPDYPAVDAVHGLALNGSFEEPPDLVHWAYGGGLPVALATDAYTGTYAAQLGEPMQQTDQEGGMAWLRQTMYIRPEWERPVLTFRYRTFVNDTVDYSDLRVWLARSNSGWLAEVLHDGFRSCDDPSAPPPPGYDLGWRTASYDLSAFKGQTVRAVFENRSYSLGIWTYIDNVRVVDAGPPLTLPEPFHNYYLPLMAIKGTCFRPGPLSYRLSLH